MLTFRSIVAAATVFLAATSADAITFTVDELNSSVTLTESGSGFVCDITNCGVSVELAADLRDGVDGPTFDLDNPGDTNSFDFLTFIGSGIGAFAYDITAKLAFDPPTISVTSGGSGGALLFFGSIVGGLLEWNDVPALLVLDDGSEVTVDFEGMSGLFLGNSVTTSASVTLEKVASVPLPASALLLILGLTGLVGVRGFKEYAA